MSTNKSLSSTGISPEVSEIKEGLDIPSHFGTDCLPVNRRKFFLRQVVRSNRMDNQQRTHFNPFEAPGATSLRTPIIRIEDHKSEVLSCDFHHSGKFLLAANRSGLIRVCDIYGTFPKAMVMKGHTDAVMQAEFSKDGFEVFSCSADGTIGIYDTFRGFRKSKLEGHTDGVNSINATSKVRTRLCSGSNDGTVRLWDVRENECTMTMDSGSKVTSTCFSQTEDYVISGGDDNDIKVWDVRNGAISWILHGHTGKITGVALSPCGTLLLSHSVDNTLRVWDIRPEITFDRCINVFPSYQHPSDGLLRCAWSTDGSMISAGNSDRDVFVWDAETGETLHELAGHESTINDISFHPKESIILSASNDKYLFLHEM